VQAREAVMKNIDWDCQVETLFREKNLGCKIAVSSSLQWFFGQVEMGIVLEDDCVPDLTFFAYCESLLFKYREDHRVMHISGTNFLGRKSSSYPQSYYFSKYVSIWGWASWARAWKAYDPELIHWPEYKKQGLLKNILTDPIEEEYFTSIF